jgi:hypothetical protein
MSYSIGLCEAGPCLQDSLAVVTLLDNGEELPQLSILPGRYLQSIKTQPASGNKLAVLKGAGYLISGIGET